MVSKKSQKRKVVSRKTTKKRPIMKKKTSRKKSKKRRVVKKRSSRKKSKKRPVMKKRSTRKKGNYLIMKGGVVTLLCQDKPYNINNTDNIEFNSLYFTERIEIETMLNNDFKNSKTNETLPFIGSGSFNDTCDLGKYKGKAKKIPKDKDYVMKFVTSGEDEEIDVEEIDGEIEGREMHMKISTLLLKKDSKNFSIVPDILLFSKKEPVYSIEEKGTIDLLEYMDRFARQTKQFKLHNILEMIEAVYFLNNNNIVHRDIKLENFLVFNTGRNLTIKIIDFGMAMELKVDTPGSKEIMDNVAYKPAGGTPGYAPLEQIIPSFNSRYYFNESELTFTQFKNRDVYSLAASIKSIIPFIDKQKSNINPNLSEDYLNNILYPEKMKSYTLFMQNFGGEEKYNVNTSIGNINFMASNYKNTDQDSFVANIDARPTIEQFYEDVKPTDYIKAKQICVEMTTKGPCQNESMKGHIRCIEHTCSFMGCLKPKSSKVQSCSEHTCNKPGCINVISGEGKEYCDVHPRGISSRVLQHNPEVHGLIAAGTKIALKKKRRGF